MAADGEDSQASTMVGRYRTSSPWYTVRYAICKHLCQNIPSHLVHQIHRTVAGNNQPDSSTERPPTTYHVPRRICFWCIELGFWRSIDSFVIGCRGISMCVVLCYDVLAAAGGLESLLAYVCAEWNPACDSCPYSSWPSWLRVCQED